MIYILILIFFGFGIIAGSFLNVVISRFNTTKTLGGRSACMSCRSKLSWYELVPILSFLFLRGRCRSCQTRISRMYPAVEFTTGIVFAFLFLKFQGLFLVNILDFLVTFAFYAFTFSTLIVIAFYDFKHQIIPDKLAIILAVSSFVGLFLFNQNGLDIHMPSLMDMASGFIIALPFLLLFIVSQGAWMGLGDAKLAVSLGWLLGLSRAISGVFLAFCVGAFISVFLVILSRKYNMKSEIPFAPFLVFGAILAFIFNLIVFSGFQ